MAKGDFKDKAKASAAGKKSKRGKLKITLLKEAIGIDRTTKIVEQIEKNIYYFIHHKDESTRLDATKAFTDYYKPRKREHSGEINSNVKVVFENIKNAE